MKRWEYIKKEKELGDKIKENEEYFDKLSEIIFYVLLKLKNKLKDFAKSLDEEINDKTKRENKLKQINSVLNRIKLFETTLYFYIDRANNNFRKFESYFKYCTNNSMKIFDDKNIASQISFSKEKNINFLNKHIINTNKEIEQLNEFLKKYIYKNIYKHYNFSSKPNYKSIKYKKRSLLQYFVSINNFRNKVIKNDKEEKVLIYKENNNYIKDENNIDLNPSGSFSFVGKSYYFKKKELVIFDIKNAIDFIFNFSSNDVESKIINSLKSILENVNNKEIIDFEELNLNIWIENLEKIRKSHRNTLNFQSPYFFKNTLRKYLHNDKNDSKFINPIFLYYKNSKNQSIKNNFRNYLLLIGIENQNWSSVEKFKSEEEWKKWFFLQDINRKFHDIFDKNIGYFFDEFNLNEEEDPEFLNKFKKETGKKSIIFVKEINNLRRHKEKFIWDDGIFKKLEEMMILFKFKDEYLEEYHYKEFLGIKVSKNNKLLKFIREKIFNQNEEICKEDKNMFVIFLSFIVFYNLLFFNSNISKDKGLIFSYKQNFISEVINMKYGYFKHKENEKVLEYFFKNIKIFKNFKIIKIKNSENR